MLYSLTYSATRGLNAALRRSFRVWDSTAIRVPAATFASTTATLKSTTVAFHQAYAGPSALDKNAGPTIRKGLATAAHRAGMKTLNRHCWCGRNWGQVYSRSLSSSGALRTDDQAEFKKYGFEDVRSKKPSSFFLCLWWPMKQAFALLDNYACLTACFHSCFCFACCILLYYLF